MTCGPSIQRRRDIYNAIIKKPWISEAELYERFSESAKTKKAIYIGLRQKIFLSHIRNNRQTTYIVNPELQFEKILRYISTYAIDKLKAKSLEQQYLLSSKRTIQTQRQNRQKALSSVNKHAFSGNLNTYFKHTSPNEQAKYVEDVERLRVELKNARKYRQDMGLDGIDRGALK